MFTDVIRGPELTLGQTAGVYQERIGLARVQNGFGPRHFPRDCTRRAQAVTARGRSAKRVRFFIRSGAGTGVWRRNIWYRSQYGAGDQTVRFAQVIWSELGPGILEGGDVKVLVMRQTFAPRCGNRRGARFKRRQIKKQR